MVHGWQQHTLAHSGCLWAVSKEEEQLLGGQRRATPSQCSARCLLQLKATPQGTVWVCFRGHCPAAQAGPAPGSRALCFTTWSCVPSPGTLLHCSPSHFLLNPLHCPVLGDPWALDQALTLPLHFPSV